MLDDETAKAEIQKLIGEYQEYKTKKLSEGAIELKLILPLFDALGWSTRYDTIPKESIQRKEGRGISDFTFQMEGRTVFYLEAKKLDVKLTETEAKQAISYSIAKRVPFAVLTNFAELKIFCVNEDGAYKKPLRHFKYEQFIEKFSELKLLSKPAFQKGELLKVAEDERGVKEGKTIDKILLDDIMLIRRKIAKNIEERYPNEYSIPQRDDIIQRILDRMIFIRKCEDTQNNVNDKVLSELLGHSDAKIYSKLKEVFADYDDVFNSGLFKPNYDNDCDRINLDGHVIKELIGRLYDSRDNQYIYNFYDISADVLGQVYEQYLGLILAETKTGRMKLKGGNKK